MPIKRGGGGRTGNEEQKLTNYARPHMGQPHCLNKGPLNCRYRAGHGHGRYGDVEVGRYVGIFCLFFLPFFCLFPFCPRRTSPSGSPSLRHGGAAGSGGYSERHRMDHGQSFISSLTPCFGRPARGIWGVGLAHRAVRYFGLTRTRSKHGF